MPCKFKFLSGTIVKHLIDFKENRDMVANAGATISAFDILDEFRFEGNMSILL